MTKDITPNDVMQAVDTLRKTVEAKGIEAAEAKQIADNVQKTLEAQEAKNQKLVADIEDERKSREEMKDRVEAMERELITAGNKKSGENYKEKPEYKALQIFAQKGTEGLDMEQKALLRSDNNTDGGYLVMPEMDNMIIKAITEISPVRQVARVKSVGNKTLTIPTRTTIPTATYEGEAAAADDSQSTYGSESLTCYRLSTTVPFTMDLLMDAAFDLESNIMQDISEAFAFAEGNKFVLGTGAKQPEGFLSTAAGLTQITSASSGTITGDDLIELTGELKVGYMPMYAFNRRTLAFFRTLKGSDGQYLWQAGLAGEAPNTLAGERYILLEDMPDIAANSLSVVYADFMRGYTITDRTGMEMIRDPYSQKRKNIIELTFHKYNHGQVVLKEAFVVLKTKA